MKSQSVPFAAWLASCVVISYLISAVTPNAGVMGYILASVTTGLIGFIALARHENLSRAQELPPQHHYHHYDNCEYGGPGDDDGYDGWLRPPSRN